MGSLFKSTYTMPLPKEAKVFRGTVTWTAKGEKRTGKLSGEDRVRCKSEYWTAQYIDETGKIHRVSTKTKLRAAAKRILAHLEDNVDRVRAGVVTRSELQREEVSAVPIDTILAQFETKMIAGGSTTRHIGATKRKIESLIASTGIVSIADMEQSLFERWVAGEIKSGQKTPRTINSYIVAVKSFLNWCVANEYLPVNPIGRLKKLNEEVGRRKNRRALTADELIRLFEAARNNKHRSPEQAEERELIYRLLAGTGLRSTELGLATPSQFDFDRCRFTVLAAITKNKKSDVLPIRPDLAAALKAWIAKREILPGSRIFNYDVHSLRRSLYADLKNAGIIRVGEDGRSIDVHSLRKTFGTLLARAGVPLTTTQRLMRHSTPELTARLYIDVDPIDLQQAVAKLPMMGEPAAKE